MILTTLLGMLLSLPFANAAIRNAMLRGRPQAPQIPLLTELSVMDPNGTALPTRTIVYYFDQLIDHSNPSLGTFRQRYWMDWEFYKKGGPIVLMTPGEDNAEGYLGYLTNRTMPGMIAQQQCGATVLLEHRFFGYSNPYPNLTSQSLEVLTIQQAIDDLVHFAQSVNLTTSGGGGIKHDAPWVLVGGSYAGALTSWTMVNRPGIFRAGYASSAVVEAITDFYGYFTPIREYMPQNCSSDVQAVVAYLDELYAANDTVAMQSLKEAFGLGDLSHIDDFAAALQINLFDWQDLQPNVGPGAMFFRFCDALEVKDGKNAPPTGWGLDHAIQAWGSFWNGTYYAHVCSDTDAETCLGTYDTSDSYWTNVTIDNNNRSWFWLLCNQLGFYVDSPPSGQPTITSQILRPIYQERQCVNMFPDKFSLPPSPSVVEINNMYKGWNTNMDRLFFANGLRDPWREATVSADGLNKANTTTQPIYEGDGFHASDMIASSGKVDKTVHAVQMAGLEFMKMWLA